MPKQTKRWMPMFWPDYLADTGHLSAAEHGAYMLLIAHYWMKGGLPKDDNMIRRITRVPAVHWPRIRNSLAPFFGDPPKGTLWAHKRVDLELAYAIEKSRINSTNVSKRYIGRTTNVDTPTPTPKGLDSKRGNGSHFREEGEASGHPRKKEPPRHGAFKKDHSRVFFHHGTPEWAAYADDYREHHNGLDPPMQWNGLGSWFNWSGESILEQERQGA
jgi:uncharacterized protein YdaU (DUF1376 family)